MITNNYYQSSGNNLIEFRLQKWKTKKNPHNLINKTRTSERTARHDGSPGFRRQLLPGVIGHLGVRSAGESNNRENFRSSGII